jgi:hypothetical protein
MAPKARSNLVPYYASEIKVRWQKVLESIFEVADLLVQAKDEKLDSGDWERLKDELPFSDSILKKLLVIGRDPRLRKPSLYKLLPSSYSIIYEIHQLKEDELKLAIKDGQISTRMNRAQFIAWRDAQRGNVDESDALNPLSVGFTGLAPLGEVAAGDRLSGTAALKLKQELDALAKRYKVHVQYAKRGVLQKARGETVVKLGRKLQRSLARYNREVGQEDLAVIENALWQHRFREAGEDLPYEPTYPLSIENKKHLYSIHNGWDYKRMLREMDRRKIITTWTPIKDKKELEGARCLQLAMRYLETNDVFERRQNKKALRQIARSTSKHAKIAQWCLEQIAPFERVGLR